MGGDRVRRTRRRVGARRVAVVAVVLAGLIGPVPTSADAVPGAPSPPRSVRPFPGNGQATLKWHPPDDLNGYPVTQWSIVAYNHRDTPLPTRIFTSTATTYVYPDLSNSREYTFTVAAKNRNGWSGKSARSKPVTIGAPDRPAPPKASAGVARATVTWTTPKGNGAFVKAYVVTPYLDDTKQAKARVFNAPKTKQVITGLRRGRRYTFTVSARNNRGVSKPSRPSAAIVTK
jgi:hypothetical protein